MRFIHTADWQIGMKAEAVGQAGQRVREERLEAGERVVSLATNEHADFILLAGDVFEDNGVDRLLIQKVGDILASFRGEVYIIPGNHDPAVPGSVWEHPVWKAADRLHVLLTETPVERDGCSLFPCPAMEKYSAKDPTAWIRADQAKGICIGVAHGTVEGIEQNEPDYPIPRGTPERCGLDYLALGHWHSTAVYEGADGVGRMAYSGTHETSKFGERDSGNVLLVEIAELGAAPVLKPLHTSGLTWEIIEEELRETGELAAVRKRVEAITNPGSVLLEVRLRGCLSAAEQEETERIEEILRSRFLFGRLETGGLLPSPEDDSWLGGLPAGIIRETASKLREMAAVTGDGKQAVAARALRELYAIVGEISK